jgi:hypothetical protein
LPFINFINSIKNSFIGKRHFMPGEQKAQTKAQNVPHTRLPDFERTKRIALQSSAEHLQRAEKDSVTTRQTMINNSEGTPTPLIIRTPIDAPRKRKKQGPPPTDADSRSFLFDLILETENLGPVLLRLGEEGRLYKCSHYAESEEIATYLYQEFEDIRLLLAELLQKTSLGVTFLSLKDDHGPEKEHFIIDTRV